MLIANKYNSLFTKINDEINEPFTIKCLSGKPSFEWSYIAYSNSSIPSDNRFPIDLIYSLNNGEWKPMIPAPAINFSSGLPSTGTIVSLKPNDVLRIKAGPTGNTTFSVVNYSCELFYLPDGNDVVELSLSGNIMTLLNGNSPSDTISEPYAFADMGMSGALAACFVPLSIGQLSTRNELIDISNLRLPATSLSQECYFSMFAYMLGLTTVPRGVLTKATTLASACYSYMFAGCSNLNTIYCDWDPVVFSSGYTTGWLNGVSSTGTFYCNATLKDWLEANPSQRGTNTVPSGWSLELLT